MTLREYLFRKNLTVTFFSEMVGCSRHHMNRIKNGYTKPSWRLAKDIVDTTDGEITLAELLEGVKK